MARNPRRVLEGALRRLRSSIKEPNFLEVDQKDLEVLFAVVVSQAQEIRRLRAAQAGRVSRLSPVR